MKKESVKDQILSEGLITIAGIVIITCTAIITANNKHELPKDYEHLSYREEFFEAASKLSEAEKIIEEQKLKIESMSNPAQQTEGK